MSGKLGKLLPQQTCFPHRTINVGIWRVLIEEDNSLAAWTLSRVSVLQSLRSLTEHILAPGAPDRKSVIHDYFAKRSFDSEAAI